MAAVMHGDGQPPELLPADPTLEAISSEPGPGFVHSSIPRKAIIGWLAALDSDIASTVAELKDNRPNMFAHPIQRLRYVGSIAVQAGKRQAINYIADKIAGHDDMPSTLAQ